MDAKVNEIYDRFQVSVTLVQGTELYHRYEYQSGPQPCYIAYDPDSKKLRADWLEGNHMCLATFFNRRIEWGLSPLREEDANRLLLDIAPSCSVISEGYAETWNGSNYVGVYDDNAREAIKVIEDKIDTVVQESSPLRGEYAEDLFQGANLVGLGLKKQMTPFELTVLVEDLEEICRDEHGVVEVIGLIDYLLEKQEILPEIGGR